MLTCIQPIVQLFDILQEGGGPVKFFIFYFFWSLIDVRSLRSYELVSLTLGLV